MTLDEYYFLNKIMKYSILMPYYKRSVQLKITLESFAHFYKDRDDTEIILIEDNKSSDQDKFDLENLLNNFSFMNIKRIHGIIGNSFSPASNYNIGAEHARGEFLILTNPESMHTVNVLQGLDEEFAKSKDNYVVCSCLSVDMDDMLSDKSNDIDGLWYQHSVHRNTGCHFCSAISKDNYLQAGGFSNEFSEGIGFDDDDFRNKVQHTGIQFIYRDDLITLHLSHDKDKMDYAKYMHNKNLYNTKWGLDSFRAESLPVNTIVHRAVIKNGDR